jgi:hypothetical protein
MTASGIPATENRDISRDDVHKFAVACGATWLQAATASEVPS